MKNFGKLLAFTLLFSWQFLSAADIKVMSYNIHTGNPPAQPSSYIDLPAIAAVINAASPDLVALQEVDKNTTRSGGVDQAAYLANATGMNYYYAKTLNFQGGEYGIAILSKYPILESSRYELPKADGVTGEQRVMAIIAVMINGQKVYFGATHFDIIEANKEVQATKVVEIAQGITGPFILAGDFNAKPTTQPMLTLREAFNLPCTNCQYTSSAASPTKTIDYVLYNNQVLQNRFVAKYEVINESLASDHLPVMATFSDRSPQVLSWQFASPATNGREASVAATFKEIGLNASTLVRGDGLRTTNNDGGNISLGNGFAAGTGVTSSTALTDTAIAVANEMYFGFDVVVKEGYKLNLDHIRYKARISGGGAKTWYWKYSVDGTNFHKIAEPEILTAATADAGEWQPDVSLSHINALKNIAHGTAVKFRLYVSGSNTSTGSTALGRSASGTNNDPVLILGGTVDNINPPTKLLSWNFFNPATAGNEVTINSNFNNVGVNVATLSRGDGLRTKNNANNDIAINKGFSAGAKVTSADTTAAKNNNLYFAFNLDVKSNYQASLNKITYKVRISGGGAKSWYWTYSLNGTTFHKLADPAILTAATADEGVAMPEVSLENVPALQNLVNTTVYFRLYINGANATTGTTAIGRSLNANDDALQLFGVIEELNPDLLPVTLSNFKGKRERTGVKLNWTTASEINNNYFEILRYTENQKTAISIAKISGLNRAAHYTYNDQSPEFGYNYYRLKQVDFNGDATLSEVLAVNNNSSLKDDLKVYVKDDQLFVVIDMLKSAQANVGLINLDGKKMIDKKAPLQSGINTVQLPVGQANGIYIVTVNIDGETIAKKISIQ